MLTFLELYQTMLGFVFFKLYTDAGLVYPPPLDSVKEASAAGVGAFKLQEVDKTPVAHANGSKDVEVEGKKIAGKDVRKTIKDITMRSLKADDTSLPVVTEENQTTEVSEDFVQQPSKTNPGEASDLTTLQTLSSLPQSTAAKLFAPYTFFVSRETSRPLFEFIIRSFGGRVGWPATSGSGSPIDIDDESITHVIIDRPLVSGSHQLPKRKYVQPQWVVDCVNAGKILSEEPYRQGATLPPHLSPFGEGIGAYDPTQDEKDIMDVSESEEEEGEQKEESDEGRVALDTAVAQAAGDVEQLRLAELQAEVQGVDPEAFEKKVKAAKKKVVETSGNKAGPDNELEMNKMMMSRKQRKLYDKMKYSENKRVAEVRLFTCLRLLQ